MKKVSIIICIWKRIDKLERFLNMLYGQTYKDFVLFIWNNNMGERYRVDAIIDKFRGKLKIDWQHSNYNKGGFGRFIYAKQILPRREGIFIFLDDDEVFQNNTIETFVKEYEDKTISSWWAWKFTENINYWERVRCGYNDTAHYCGTGGMVIDSKIFYDDELFKCPERYWFMEDLWLSYYADAVHDYKLRGSSVIINEELDGKNQHHKLVDLKPEFLKYLVNEKGWILK